MRMQLVIAAALCALMLSTAAYAQWTTVYQTGFDTPPFVLGQSIDNIDGWETWTDTARGNAAQVTTQKEPDPSTNQFMYISSTASTSGVRPIDPITGGRVRLTFNWIMLATDVNSNLDAYGMWVMVTGTPTPSASPRTGMLTSLYDTTTSTGRLLAWSTGSGWLQYANFELNTKYQLAMDVNLDTGLYDVYLNGQRMLSDLAFYSPGTQTVSDIIFRRRYKSGTFGVDDVTVEQLVPEPSSMLALVFGVIGVAGLTRRRK